MPKNKQIEVNPHPRCVDCGGYEQEREGGDDSHLGRWVYKRRILQITGRCEMCQIKADRKAALVP